jgi:hypothetical protein
LPRGITDNKLQLLIPLKWQQAQETGFYFLSVDKDRTTRCCRFPETGDRCYDLKNILAKKLGE